MNKKEAIAFKKRWKIVNKYEKKELRRTSLEKKFEQLALLMASFELFRNKNFSDEHETESIERWSILRRKLCG